MLVGGLTFDKPCYLDNNLEFLADQCIYRVQLMTSTTGSQSAAKSPIAMADDLYGATNKAGAHWRTQPADGAHPSGRQAAVARSVEEYAQNWGRRGLARRFLLAAAGRLQTTLSCAPMTTSASAWLGACVYGRCSFARYCMYGP